MTHSTVTHAEALRRLLAATKLIDYADCKDETVWQALGAAQGTAEGVLRDGEKQEPVAYDVMYDGESCGNMFRTLDRAQEHKRHMDKAYPGHQRVIQPMFYAAPAPSPQVVAAVPEVILKRTDEIRQTMGNPTGIGRGTLIGYVECLLAHIAFTNGVAQPASGSAAPSGDVMKWISVDERLPEAGEPVLVFVPESENQHQDIRLDCIDPNDDDAASWYDHNEHYEHFCVVAKPPGSIGPSEKAPYTHWCAIPDTIAITATKE